MAFDGTTGDTLNCALFLDDIQCLRGCIRLALHYREPVPYVSVSLKCQSIARASSTLATGVLCQGIRIPAELPWTEDQLLQFRINQD